MTTEPNDKQKQEARELLPCPFCPAQLIPFPKDHLPEDLQSDAAQWFQIIHNAGCYFVLLGFGDYPIHRDRLEAWNTRALSSRDTEIREVLEGLAWQLDLGNNVETHWGHSVEVNCTPACLAARALWDRLSI